MKWSILIPTLPEEYNIIKLKRLTNILNPQIERYPGQVELVINDAGRAVPTGTKRNQLIKDSDSEYFSFIDDDDVVPAYYVSEIMTALEQNPDVVTFIGFMTTDGGHRTNFTIKLGSDYTEKNYHYYRWPNHLTVMKRELVGHIKFRDVWQQEDYHWSAEIANRKLLKNEVHIQKDLYHYDFINRPKRYAAAKVR